jgi:hypothetical protein
MFLVEILLPLYDNDGRHLAADLFQEVRVELQEQFGGFTAHTRAPAEGSWTGEARTARDDIVIFEVMAAALDRTWWRGYRRRLEARFRQDEVVIRAHAIEIL